MAPNDFDSVEDERERDNAIRSQWDLRSKAQIVRPRIAPTTYQNPERDLQFLIPSLVW